MYLGRGVVHRVCRHIPTIEAQGSRLEELSLYLAQTLISVLAKPNVQSDVSKPVAQGKQKKNDFHFFLHTPTTWG